MKPIYLYRIIGEELKVFEVSSPLSDFYRLGISAISLIPGVVTKGNVWLEERNDKMAIDLLLHDAVENMELLIMCHKNTVRILQQGVKED